MHMQWHIPYLKAVPGSRSDSCFQALLVNRLWIASTVVSQRQKNLWFFCLDTEQSSLRGSMTKQSRASSLLSYMIVKFILILQISLLQIYHLLLKFLLRQYLKLLQPSKLNLYENHHHKLQ